VFCENDRWQLCNPIELYNLEFIDIAYCSINGYICQVENEGARIGVGWIAQTFDACVDVKCLTQV